ncbi:MAG: branched-chain alpha-keto acid dehydrogenase subunit E2, partial [Pseudomonadota bacterium]|nr:branched-chain alpha-keto acid dehydrogenase subunit E2 [Pseudomonadota bacterium]
MAETKQVLIPDIGDFKDVPVIEVLVKAGDSVKAEDPLIVLESDKATIEVPSPFFGVISEVSVKVGDKVAEGTPVLVMQVPAGNNVAETPQPEATVSASQSTPQLSHPASPSFASAQDYDSVASTQGPSVSGIEPALQTPSQSASPLPPIDEAAFGKAHA